MRGFEFGDFALKRGISVAQRSLTGFAQRVGLAQLRGVECQRVIEGEAAFQSQAQRVLLVADQAATGCGTINVKDENLTAPPASVAVRAPDRPAHKFGQLCGRGEASA